MVYFHYDEYTTTVYTDYLQCYNVQSSDVLVSSSGAVRNRISHLRPPCKGAHFVACLA